MEIFTSGEFLQCSQKATLAKVMYYTSLVTVKILKFGIPQTIAIIVLKIEKFDLTLH